MSIRRAGLVAVLLAVAACSDWTGVREVAYDDPYIQQLDPNRKDGWLGRIGLYRAYAHVDRAFQLEAEGQLDRAAGEVVRYLEQHPEDARARAYYVDLLSRLGRSEQVVEEASRLLEVAPDYFPALMARGRARARLGDPGGAVDDLLAASRASTALADDPTLALEEATGYALEYAMALEAQRRWQGAQVAYTQALELPLSEEQRVQSLRGRARARAELGRVADAREDLEATVELRPGDPELRLEAAELALRASDPASAAAHLEATLALRATTVAQRRRALDRLATAREELGQHARAAARVEELIAMGADAAPSLRALHVRAGGLRSAAGQPARAAAHLEAAAGLAEGSSRAELLSRAAALHQRAGNRADAVAALRAAVAADPSSARLRARLGQALMQAGRTEEAIAVLQEVLGQDPEQLSDDERTAARLALAAAHEEAGRIEEAVALYRTVVDDASTDTAARVHALERLATLYGQRGEHRDAATALMALHQETGDPEWLERAADSYALAEVWDEAAAAYREARDAGALTGPDGARRLGVALYQAGSRTEAEEVLETIPSEERTLLDLQYLAALAREDGDSARAVTYYQRALGRATTAADSAFLYRSIGYLRLGRDDSAAVAALSRAQALEPDPGVRLDLARAQLRTGRTDAALQTLEQRPEPGTEHALGRLDLLAEIHAARGDSAGVLGALEEAADQEPTAERFNRLGFYYERMGDDRAAAAAFERAYEADPSAVQAARVAYAYRRADDDLAATIWFRRSIDAAATQDDTTAVDLDAARREVALLTDRLAFAAYVSYRGEGAAAVPLPGGGVGQAGVASQGGLEVRVLPLVQVTPWGRDVDVFGRLFWGFEDGLSIDTDSYQGQLGIRYRPRFLPGTALGVERWIGVGSAARDLWATRLQASRWLGRPYPEPGAGLAPFASLYGDAAYLFDDPGTYTLYGEARPGVVIPVAPSVALLPHWTLSAYRQDPGGIGQSYVEAGPGVGLRLRFAREGEYTKDFWSVQLMGQYRWGVFPEAWDAGGENYDELVLTLILRF